MRLGVYLFTAVLVGGCASRPAPPPVAGSAPALVYDDAVAAALVFDPPVVINAPPTDFSREGRGAAAFAGFDDVVTTFYYLSIDDRQGGYGKDGRGRSLDRFERQAVTERVGVSYR
jgi:hypothetical protein